MIFSIHMKYETLIIPNKQVERGTPQLKATRHLIMELLYDGYTVSAASLHLKSVNEVRIVNICNIPFS